MNKETCFYDICGQRKSQLQSHNLIVFRFTLVLAGSFNYVHIWVAPELEGFFSYWGHTVLVAVPYFFISFLWHWLWEPHYVVHFYVLYIVHCSAFSQILWRQVYYWLILHMCQCLVILKLDSGLLSVSDFWCCIFNSVKCSAAMRH